MRGSARSRARRAGASVALVAHAGLDADEDVAEAFAQTRDRAAVAELPPGAGPQTASISGQPGLAAHVVVGGDARMHVGWRAQALGIALDHALAQALDSYGGTSTVVTLVAPQRREVVQALEDRQEGRGAGVAGIRREVEDHAGDAALPARRAAVRSGARRAASASARSLQVCMSWPSGLEPAAAAAPGAGLAAGVAAAAVDHRPGRPVELGDRDHHRRLDRQQPRSSHPTARASGTRPASPTGRARRARRASPRRRAHRCRPVRRRARSRSARPPRRRRCGRRGRRTRPPGGVEAGRERRNRRAGRACLGAAITPS